MIDALVIDANVVIEWAANEASTEVGRRTRDLVPDAVLRAPAIFWAESRNGILNKHKLDAIGAELRDEALSFVDALPVRLDDVVASPRALRIALNHGLTVYDAYYVELASRTLLPLATNDHAMRKAARAEGLSLV